MAEILAAGAVLWRDGEHGTEVAVVHRPRYDDWSLPKGKLDDGESLPAAARREVAEETGFTSVLGRPLGQIGYKVDVPQGSAATAYKTVDYYTARVLDGEFTVNDEVDQLRWLPVPDAHAALTYKRDRQVLGWFAADPAPVTTVLLVRHAKAGKRDNWSGPDQLRPLSPAGHAQAQLVRELVPHFGVDRVHAAPPVRCAQTVLPAAEDLRVPVLGEPLLGEDGYWLDESAGLDRFLRIVAGGGTPVVCSQGGVIPELVSTLADAAGLRLPAISSKKGSVWVLSFTGSAGGHPRLFAADYVADPACRPQPA